MSEQWGATSEAIANEERPPRNGRSNKPELVARREARNRPTTYVITSGDLTGERVCELCAEFRTRFGTLIDPNGHKWIICSECINTLWEDRQFKVEQPEPALVNGLVSMLKLAKSIECDCTLCQALIFGAEIAGHNVQD